MPEFKNVGTKTISVENYLGVNVNVIPGVSVKTFKILTGSDWERISDEPYAVTGVSVTVTSPDVVENLEDYLWIELRTNDSGISVTADVATNPNAYPLKSGESFWLDNQSGMYNNIALLGSGTVTVIGLPR